MLLQLLSIFQFILQRSRRSLKMSSLKTLIARNVIWDEMSRCVIDRFCVLTTRRWNVYSLIITFRAGVGNYFCLWAVFIKNMGPAGHIYKKYGTCGPYLFVQTVAENNILRICTITLLKHCEGRMTLLISSCVGTKTFNQK